VNGTLQTVDGRSVLRFERRLAHPLAKVWRAITEPAQLTHWFPADMAGEFQPGGKIDFIFREGEAQNGTGTITEFDPPRVFAYSWGDDILRWELQPDGDGCVLTFTHTFDDRPSAGSFAAGWHYCLDGLALVLEEKPVEVPNRWTELHVAYDETFGLLEGSASKTADGWIVRFERVMTKPVEEVWAALTGSVTTTVGGPPPVQATNRFVPAGPVTIVKPPALLEYEWQPGDGEGGRVRWELSPSPGGGRVILTQTIPAGMPERGVTALAAWHTHLELLAHRLQGRDVRRWPDDRTAELRKYYADHLR